MLLSAKEEILLQLLILSSPTTD